LAGELYAGLRIPTGACRNQNFAVSPVARLRRATAAFVVNRNGADHQRLIREGNGVVGLSIVFIRLTVC
jgi:hypothetical protein